MENRKQSNGGRKKIDDWFKNTFYVWEEDVNDTRESQTKFCLNYFSIFYYIRNESFGKLESKGPLKVENVETYGYFLLSKRWLLLLNFIGH